MAGSKDKVMRNKTEITQIVYDENNNKIEVVPGATVTGNPAHYITKYGAVLEEVKPRQQESSAGGQGAAGAGGAGGEKTGNEK